MTCELIRFYCNILMMTEDVFKYTDMFYLCIHSNGDELNHLVVRCGWMEPNGPFCHLSSLNANVSLDEIHCRIYCLSCYILACGSLSLSHFSCVAALSYYHCHGAFFSSSSSFFSLWLDRNPCQSFWKRIKC